jgi:hypothetical protein
MSEVNIMSVHNKKVFTGIICGLIAISIVSIACAGTEIENSVMSAKENAAVQTKVGAGPLPSTGGPAGDYFPEFEKLKVDPAYKYLQLKPGDCGNFTVSVENNDNKTIVLNPRSLIIPYTENFIDESWISISPSEKKSLKPGEKEKFEVRVSIPKDAKTGNYAVLIAFTEKVPEGDVVGVYSNFPGTMQLNMQVWIPPSVQILTPYIYDLVEPGKSYTYEIKLRNTGNQDVAISPELTQEGGIYYADATSSTVSSSTESSSSGSSSSGSSSSVSSSAAYSIGLSQAFENEAITVEAPEKITAGQTTIVKLKLKVPANSKGSYSGSLNLHIDDPGISNGGVVPLSFRILPVPEKPYETTFEASTDAPITLGVTAYQYEYGIYKTGGERDLAPSFNVSLKDPSGKEIKPTLVSTKSSGSINIVDDSSQQPQPLLDLPSNVKDSTGTYKQISYQGSTTTFIETYTVPGAAGKWTLSILPKNTENFEYSVTIGAAN